MTLKCVYLVHSTFFDCDPFSIGVDKYSLLPLRVVWKKLIVGDCACDFWRCLRLGFAFAFSSSQTMVLIDCSLHVLAFSRASPLGEQSDAPSTIDMKMVLWRGLALDLFTLVMVLGCQPWMLALQGGLVFSLINDA